MSDGIDVLGLGVLAVDEIVSVAAYPQEDAKVRVLARERRCGGLTATALVAAARLGARCACAGALGDDPDSAFVRAALAAEGVDIAAIARDPQARPFRGIVIVGRERGSRTILSEPGDWGTAPFEELPRAGVVLVDHHLPARALRAIEALRGEGAQVVADLERETPQAPIIDGLADHLIVPLAYARARTGREDPAAAAEALWHPRRRLVAVTDGARGAWYAADGSVRHQPAFAVELVDTTGCGDVFHGAYAWALSCGLPPEERMRLASAAAALKATRSGGQAGAPTAAELQAFLRSPSPSAAGAALPATGGDSGLARCAGDLSSAS